jgi:hypothetical protein
VSVRERTEERLEAAGWERWRPDTHSSVVFWRSPSRGQWYAHRQAVIMLRGEGPT